MKRCLTLLFVLIGMSAQAQHSLQGQVSDTVADPIEFATVSLLNPEDSTLSFFGITNSSGVFEIKNIAKGTYLLQVAFLGFKTHYHKLEIPVQGGSIGRVELKSLAKQLAEVEITSEKVPLMIKKDTIEYNAGAFKIKPDATVEELLKKLPGVEVDKAGNIKAQGENVSKVLVDGKEFFGNDPKVATKNLPADAINKVQVFNKRSDASEFLGIDDGSRERTVNLTLKDNKKLGHFGDLQAGGGTGERYKLSAKVYKFTKKTQFAMLSMLNNINQSGFSFEDYLNFNGGIGSLLAGGGNVSFNIGEDMPIDFGRPVNGYLTSGAGGANYSYEYGKNKRVALSYLGNGFNKKLDQQIASTNFTNTGSFDRHGDQHEVTETFAHRLNLSWRNDVDSAYQLTGSANVGLVTNNKWTNGVDSASINDALLNRLESKTRTDGSGITGTARLSYLKKFKSNWSVFRIGTEGNYDRRLNDNEWRNFTQFFNAGTSINDWQFQNNKSEVLSYSVNSYGIYKMKNGFMLQPTITAGSDDAHFIRQQGTAPNETAVIDSLSPDFSRTYTYLKPELKLRRGAQKAQLGLGLAYEAGWLHAKLFGGPAYPTRSFGYLLPSLNWLNEYSVGRRIQFNYSSHVNEPSVDRMLPVANITSPLSRFTGDANLRPEYVHNTHLSWVWFDQFSFTSFFSYLSFRYIHDKINISRTINPDLGQYTTVINVPDDYQVRGSANFGRPIRPLGITYNIGVNETYEHGINLVNGISNTTDVLSHELKISFGNRKKEKWDVQIGGSGRMTDAKYSVHSNLNNRFYNLTGFSEVSYRPSDKWYLLATADVTQYTARSFDGAVVIPMLKAEVSHYFLKGNRGTLTLEGFDLLNQNKGLERVSELNFLRETRSNTIGRYFMLSFKYRLSKTATDNPRGGIILRSHR